MPATAGCSPNTRPSGASSCRSRRSRSAVIDAFLVGRGQEFLQPSRRRPAVDRCAPRSPISAGCARNRRPIGASTITQQVAKNMLLIERGVDRAQDQGDPARDPDRDGAAQGPHPRALSERDLSRRRRLWRRGGGADLFRQAARRADARRGGVPRRAAEGAEQLQPGALPAGGAGAPRLGARPHGRGRLRDRGRGAAAKAEPIDAAPPRRRPRASTAPYFAEEVRRELLARYGEKVLYEGGLSVRTSLDPRLQADADKALRDGLIAYDRGHGGWRGAVAPYRSRAATGRARWRRCRCRRRGERVGWQLAVVLRTESRRRGDRLRRRRRPGASRSRRCAGRGRCTTTARSAPSPRSAGDVRQARRCRAGRAVAAAGQEPAKRGRHRRGTRRAREAGRRRSICARSPRSRARWSRSTRIPAACWR